MSAIPWFLDTPSKRWLSVLAVAFLASAALMVRSFVNAAFPQEEKTVTVEPRVSVVTEHVSPRPEPVWDNPREVRENQPAPTDGRVSPFAAEDAIKARDNPVIIQQRIHRQADYLRNLIAKGELPKGFGNLTKEKVDEMEKQGIMPN